MARFPDIQFLTKLHPDETSDLHAYFIEKYHVKNVHIVNHRTITLDKLLSSSHCIINFYSAVGIEAISKGKYLLTVNVNNIPDFMVPQPVDSLIITAKTYEACIKGISFLSKKRPEPEKIKKIAAYYIFQEGDAACKATASALTKLARKSQQPL
jgi:hypothetical protein